MRAVESHDARMNENSSTAFEVSGGDRSKLIKANAKGEGQEVVV
jgi:hypothetical protein